MDYDLAIVGSGGAAFAAAIAATGKGARVAMIERGQVGGTCVNVGCVPSKALLAAAEARHVALTQPFPGIAASAGPVDMAALIAGKDALVGQLRSDKYLALAADYGWDLVAGTATFTDGPAVDVSLIEGGSRRIEAAHYLIATGSTPSAPDIDGLAGAGYLTSTTAMELDHVPESLIVLGGGYVGLEQAQLFARLGTDVTVLTRSRLASFEEPEISATLHDVFTDEGITVHLRTAVASVRRGTAGYTVVASGADGAPELHLAAEQLLVATGRRPHTDGLGLARVGVATGERGQLIVDDQLRTSNPRIWGAGDVTGHPQFVYVAAAHGALVADNALDDTQRVLDYTALPRVTFTSPTIASVGLTDAQAVAAGYPCDCRTLPLSAVPRALVNRDTRGLIKLVADAATGRLLGVHVLADGAGDVISAAVYALAAQLTVHQLATTWSPYLTMAEGLKLAAQTYTRDITKLSCCAA
jgi:mercuric reductase